MELNWKNTRQDFVCIDDRWGTGLLLGRRDDMFTRPTIPSARPLLYSFDLLFLLFGLWVAHLPSVLASIISTLQRQTASTQNGPWLFNQRDFFLPTISTRQRLFTTDITPKFSNFVETCWKTFFRYFSRENWKVVQSSVRFTAARRNKGLSGSWFRHKREKDGFADLLFSVYPHHHHLFFFFNFVNVRKERKKKEINTLPSSLFFSVCKCQRGGGGLYGGGATGVRNFSPLQTGNCKKFEYYFFLSSREMQ